MANTVKIGISASDEGFKSTLQNAAKSAAELGNAMTGAGGKSKTLNGQLREARKSAQELTMQWRALDDNMKNSDFGRNLQSQLQQVLDKAGELQDIKGDVANEIRNIASDTAIWDGAKQGIGILSSSMQSMASVVGMLGGNTEAFTKALTVMKGVEAATNTIIQIGNALQKDSALMTALRTLRKKMFSAATKEATAATMAETAAIKQQTIAQEANNAAVKANPYVAVASAVIGLTTAIWGWCTATEEATETTESYNSALDQQGTEVADQITTFVELQNEYNKVKDNVEELTKFVHNNKEKFKHCRLEVKNCDDAHHHFARNTNSYVLAADARAQAIAGEIVAIDTLGKAMSGLSKLYHKFLQGQEVDWADLRNEIQKIMNWSRGHTVDYMKSMGWEEQSDFAFGNAVAADGSDNAELMAKTMADIAIRKLNEDRKAQEKLNKALKDQLSKIDASAAEIYQEMEDYNEEVYNENKPKGNGGNHNKPTAHKPSTKGSGGNKPPEPDVDKDEDVQKLIQSWAGLNALITQANKKKNELLKSSPTYEQDKKRYEDLILMAEQLKFPMIDQSTSKGLEAAAAQVKTIIDLLPKGSKELEKWQQESDNIQLRIYEQLKEGVNTNDIGAIEELIRSTWDGISKGYIKFNSDIEDYLDELTKKARKLKIERGLEPKPKTDFERNNVDDKYKHDWDDLTKYVTEYGAKAEQYAAALQKYEDDLKAYNDAWTKYNEKLEGWQKSGGYDLLRQQAQYNELLKKRNELEQKHDDDKISDNDYEQELEQLNRQIDELSTKIWGPDPAKTKESVDGISDYAAEFAKLDNLFKTGKLTADQYNEALNNLDEKYQCVLDNVSVKSFKPKPIEPTIKMPTLPNNPLKSLSLEEIFPTLDNIPEHVNQLIQAVEQKLSQDDLSVTVRAELSDVKDRLQQRLDEITKGELTIKAIVQPSFIEKGSVDDMRASYENQGTKIQQIADDYAKGIIKSSDVAVERIAALNSQLRALGMEPVQIEIKTEGMKTIESMQNYLGMFNDTVGSTVDSIQSLVNAIDEGANAWEIFKNAISVIETILNDIATVMNIVNTLELAGNAAKEVSAPLSNENAAAKTLEAVAQSSLAATSPAAVAAMETQSAAAVAATPGIKAMSSAMMELAASNMFAAHASIPFVGAALGAASVGVMMGVMASVKALSKFADGGIVGGSYTMGDRMLVRANAGEMILNKRQQANLFKALDEGVGTSQGYTVSNVRIKGSDLYLALKNYSKIKGKSGLTTGIQ